MTKSELLKTAKPILFNTEMVKAILEERKTVTRRPVKFKKGQNPHWTGYIPDGNVLYGSNNIPAAKAPYKPGDILYVRETWNKLTDWEDQYPDTEDDMLVTYYRADYDKEMASLAKWRPSIHMPKEAARIFLRVKKVRAKRLQNITTIDTYKEGISECMIDPNCVGTCDDCMQENSPLHRFKRLWDSTIKTKDLNTYGWLVNPWVWVIEFERVEVD